MKSNEVGTTLKYPEIINGNVKNLSKSDIPLYLVDIMVAAGGINLHM